MERRRLSRERQHAIDRMVSGATYRAQRAREGKGYVFKAPPLREQAA
jgi:hypothetical protein